MNQTHAFYWSVLQVMVLFGVWAVLWIAGSPYEWLRLFVLASLVIISQRWIFKKKEAVTASGATVMAIGIFINGAIHHFPVLDQGLGKDLTVFLLLVWILITASFVRSYRQGMFYRRHLEHPIQSFGLGTWIAGTSVLGVALYERMPESRWIAFLMAFVNLCLWILFIKQCWANFRRIITTPALRNKSHGVLLLSTVSTQSLVVLYNTIIDHPILMRWSQAMILFGVILYVVGWLLVVNRYRRLREWTVADDWENTNCIIHGAMSITGLAAATSGAVSPDWTLLIWLWVLVWFVIVETIELVRVAMRLKQYGPTVGIGTHRITQWSRNFTFGMLYAFTLHFDLSETVFAYLSILHLIHRWILTGGAWIVLGLLVNECLLYIKANIRGKAADGSKMIG